MAYRAIIDSKLRMAFRMLKDLAVEATHTPSTVDFDFALGGVTSSTSTPITFKVVVIEAQQKSPVTNNQTSTILFKKADFASPKVGDKLFFLGATWIIQPELKDTGHIFMVNVSKEV